jgi:hypothetical protein
MAVIKEPSLTAAGSNTKQSLLLPAIPLVPSPFPRSLVQDAGIANQSRPYRATPKADVKPPTNAVREEPATEWSVDTVKVTPLAIVWLDDVQRRFMPTRRIVVIKNHNTAFGVWIRQIGQGVGSGGYLGPGESIALPLGPSCTVFCLGIDPAPAGTNVSFYQLGS